MRNLILFKPILWVLFLYSTAFATGDLPISELTARDPILKGTLLPDDTYVQVRTRRFSQARVVWLNFNWLKENGFYFPDSGLVPGFENEVLDALAYGVPRESDDPSLFTEQQKTFYADKYGGTGIGVNHGSGRAASRGWVQIKGIGVTPLVGKSQDFDHAHGGASLEEAMREAMWGEINHFELPYGSNRVIAIIDTGTYTEWKDGGREKRALIIREDPLRPAHFLIAQTETKTEMERLKRVAQNAPKIMKTLLSGGDYLEYVRRLAKQHAAARARRLYHGATSESNFDLSGRFLDYGTQTSLPSFQELHVLRHVEGFGKLGEIEETMVVAPLEGLKQFNPKLKLPSVKSVIKEFRDTYTEAIEYEFLLLTGAPPELLQRISQTRAYHQLATDLIQYTQLEWSTPKGTLFDRKSEAVIKETRLGDLLEICAQGKNPKEAIEKLAPQLPAELKKRFAVNYTAFIQQLKNPIQELNLSSKIVAEYMVQATRIRNSRRPMLERPGTIWRNIELISEYMNHGNRSILWDQINRVIEESSRESRTASPFLLTLETRYEHLAGKVHRRVYDLKTGTSFWESLSLDELSRRGPTELINCSVILGGAHP